MPGGFSSIALRNAALLYEPWRKLPQIARTLMPFPSLMSHSGKDAELYSAPATPIVNVRRRQDVRPWLAGEDLRLSDAGFSPSGSVSRASVAKLPRSDLCLDAVGFK